MGQPKKSMESRRSKAGPRIGRILRAFAALIVSVATLLTGTVTAQAAVGNLPGYWFNPTSSGSWYIGYHAAGLGPMGYNGDNPYYCLSAGNPLYNTGTWQEVTDTNSKIAAYMVNKYVGDRSDFTQAAVAYALHAHLDRSDTHFNEMVAAGLEGADINAVAAKANEMWNDAYNNTPTDINASYKYTEGKLKGTVNPGIMNTNKQYVAGVQYTITLNGPAVFDATGTNTYTGVTKAQEEHIAWTATDDGDVQGTVSYAGIGALRMDSVGQPLFMRNQDPQYRNGTIEFKVEASYPLDVSTVATNTFDHAGDTRPVHDTINLSGYGDRQETITGKIILNWDGNPADETVDQKVEKSFTTPLQPTVNSPDFLPSDFGWEKWKAGRYWFDVQIPKQGHMREAVDTDDREPTETWVVDAPHITTDVSKRVVGLNEKFYDTVKISGRVARGSYVKVQAYSAVPNEPDTSVPLLLDQTIQITNEQADASSEQGSFTIRTDSISSPTEGYVYFKATLYNQRGDVLDSHDLGIETETVHVLPVLLESQVTNERVTFDQWFGDKATVTGIIEPGSYLVFKAYGPTLMDATLPDGSDNPAVTSLEPLYEERVDVTAQQAEDSHNRPQTFYSKGGNDEYEKSAMVTSASGVDPGFVYWDVRLYGPDGKERARHQLGIPEETVRVEMPTISTQVSDADVSVGDAFHDVATVRGKVGRGWYVTFTAYEAVAGDTEPNGNAGKILDEARVDITDDQADNSNVKSEFDVTSPDAHSWRSGTVYWVASLHTASGAVVDKGKLGEETEKVRVRGGGIITSHAQAMGAVGGQLYDEITIYDETVGHEGTGNGNLHDNAGMIPDDSYVIVRLWRNDGHNGQTKGQMVGQIRRDVNQENFIPFEDGGEAIDGRTNRRGYQTIKVTGEQFIVPECPSDGYENAGKYNPCGAGMYYFTATLYGTDGQVLDSQDFGQSGDSTETGYPSEERTPVQKFATERAKKWFSIDSENYADKTISSYDMLKQWSYQESDVDVDKLIAQTDPGTTMRFEIWREDPASDNGDTDVKVWEGQNWDLPAIKSVEVAGVASVKKDMQKLKSETVDLTDKTLFPAGTYYYRLVIQNPDVDTNPNYNTSTDPDYNPTIDGNSNIVWYDAKRVKSESFDIIEAQSKSVEPLWTNTMSVADTITLTGVIPEGTQYEVELWKATEGMDGKTTGEKPVATTGRIDLPKEAIGDFRIHPVTFTAPWFENPGVGSYQWRFKIWTPDDKGGAPTISDEVFTAFDSAADATQAGFLDDGWQSVPQDQKSKTPKDMHGYADRHLIYEGTQVKDEHFEVIRISTDVTASPTWENPSSNGEPAVDPAGNAQSYKGENYINVSYEGADVSDHANIEGHVLEGYQLGYTLYKRADGDDASQDTVVWTYNPEALTENQKTHDSGTYHIGKDQYGDYYWVFNFRKPDGTEFVTDKVTGGETKANDSAKRIKSESFHAVSITTATYDWGAVANEIWDTAFIHGRLPKDATIRFDLVSKETGEVVQSTEPVKVGDTLANGTTEIESEHIELEKAGDYWWSEVVEFPGDHDKPFHTGRDNQQPESLHGISADTSVVTEVMAEQSNVHDTVKLENIAANDRLMAAWDLYKVNQNGGPDTDEYVTTVDAEGQLLTMGQETATSPDVNILDHYDGDWKKAVGEYYWVLRIWDKAPTTEDDRLDLYGEPGDNGGNGGSWAADEPTVTPDGVSHPGTEYRIVHTGKARDPEETFRVIHAETKAVSEEKMGVAIQDKAIVYGPVAKGTKLSWALYENDFDPETAKPLEEYADYATVTAEQEATARKDGKVEILGPEFKTERIATYNWVLSLKRPVRADEPGDDTDKDGDGIVDDKVEDTAIFTDTLGRAKETTEILTVTTKAQENATANKPFHDTALIQGNVVAGTQIEFELWQRAEGDDVSKDKLVTTTDRVTLKGGETKVDSPDVTVKFNGSYYWVEKVYRPTDQSNPDSPVEDTPFHVGERRLPNESVTVTGGLSQTGAAIGGAAGLAALLLGLGGGTVAWNKRRRRDPRGRHAA